MEKKTGFVGKMHVRFVCRTFFLRLETEIFMLSSFVLARNERKASCCFRNELTTLGEVHRPLSRFSIVAVARISDCLVF